MKRSFAKMDRKLLLRILSVLLLLFGLGFIGSSAIGYWEYVTYGVFIDLEDRLALVLSAIFGISVCVVSVFLPILFKKWAAVEKAEKIEE